MSGVALLGAGSQERGAGGSFVAALAVTKVGK